MRIGVALLLGKAEVIDILGFFDGLVAEGIDGSSWFQIGLRQLHGWCFEIEAIDNDQISAGEKLAVRWNGLESMRIDPLRDDAGQFNLVAANVCHDARDRRYRGDDVDLLLRLSGLFVFLPATGGEKECQSQNR